MAIRKARETLGRIFFQRCFYLFVVLLALIAVVPFVEPTPQGRVVTALINAFVVVATVAAVGRSVLSFVIALLDHHVPGSFAVGGSPLRSGSST